MLSGAIGNEKEDTSLLSSSPTCDSSAWISPVMSPFYSVTLTFASYLSFTVSQHIAVIRCDIVIPVVQLKVLLFQKH